MRSRADSRFVSWPNSLRRHWFCTTTVVRYDGRVASQLLAILFFLQQIADTRVITAAFTSTGRSLSKSVRTGQQHLVLKVSFQLSFPVFIYTHSDR